MGEKPNPNLHFEVGGTGYYADEILQVHDNNQRVPGPEVMPIGTTVSLEALRAALDEVAALEQRVEGLERQFPMQKGPSISWSLAEKIYKTYQAVYGSKQSLEKLAERGGFGWAEVEFIGKRYRQKTGQEVWITLAAEEA